MFKNIISADELNKNIRNKNWVIVDARFDLKQTMAGYAAYQKGHIPNAVYAHLDRELSGEVQAQSGRHPLPDPEKLIALLNQWGLDQNAQLVVYDDSQGAIAARLWWLLKWLGHENVAVLDGGLSAWQKRGYALSTVVPEPRKGVCGLNPHNIQRSDVVSTDDIYKNITMKKMLLLDARAAERYRGEVEPIDPQKGHIPNAINYPFSRNLDENGNFLPAAELRQRYETIIQNTPADKIVCMCGSGVTACHNILAMSVAGLDGAKLYAGSWSEWIRDAQRPIATGE